MEHLQIIAFKYRGKYGHFRKPYSNVSSLSYPFPPRTAIAGLLGAILGVKKEKVSETFDDRKIKIGVSIDNTIDTITHVTNIRQAGFSINYSIKKPNEDWSPKPLKNVPDYNKPVNPYPMEILRYPAYTVYLSFLDNNSSYDELISRIATNRWCYTPCMGLSEFFAEVKYQSTGDAKKLDVDECYLSTVSLKKHYKLSFEKLDGNNIHEVKAPRLGTCPFPFEKRSIEYNIHEVKAPRLGTADRRFTYENYIMSMNANPIPVKEMKSNVYQFKDKIISFL